jgi:hypothetical protein
MLLSTLPIQPGNGRVSLLRDAEWRGLLHTRFIGMLICFIMMYSRSGGDFIEKALLYSYFVLSLG